MRNRSHYLHIFLLWACSLLFWACGSSRPLTPAYVQEQPTLLPVDSLVKPDPAALAYILPYKKRVDSIMNQVIGYSARELTKGEVESPLGNFVADLMTTATRELTDAPVDMGVISTGGVRIPLPKGQITLGDIFELMPFENMIVVVELNGEQTRRLFEHAARVKNLAISNSRLLVREGEIVEITIGGQPFDPSKTYRVATSDYLANGGDNLNMLKEAPVVDRPDLLLRNAIVDEISERHAAGEEIDARLEGRVIIE